MSYPINYPTPQGSNIQTFTGRSPSLTNHNTYTWTKPQGASFVWFTLIGAGGNGDNSAGGASGAVTNFMCPAFLIPDSLTIICPAPNSSSSTKVRYYQKSTTPYDLLTANNGVGPLEGTAMTANAFTAMGFFQSRAGTAGQNGSETPSTVTFLSGGGAASSPNDANYGYSSSPNAAAVGRGFFQMQPIIVGTSGMGTGAGGIGCGGGLNTGSGGNGMVVIITW
jgi:hypothetical protein